MTALPIDPTWKQLDEVVFARAADVTVLHAAFQAGIEAERARVAASWKQSTVDNPDPLDRLVREAIFGSEGPVDAIRADAAEVRAALGRAAAETPEEWGVQFSDGEVVRTDREQAERTHGQDPRIRVTHRFVGPWEVRS